MLNYLKNIYQRHPLLTIIIIAFIPRLLAAIFSQGYAMHDDHFGPIEQPFQIMNDHSVWEHRGNPHGHSIVYPSVHYYLFTTLHTIGVTDPQDKMLIVRLLHALYSLLIIYFGYKIAEKLGGHGPARLTGLVLALLWILPFMSVRNLIEMVCIPPLMAGVYFTMRNGKPYVVALNDEPRQREPQQWNWIIAGAMFALAFIFRPQTLIVPFGVGLILLFRKEFKSFICLLSAILVTAFLTQGIVDWLAWGYPFAAFIEYFIYNAGHSSDYTTGPFYNYLLVFIGVMIPPISFLILYGYCREWKKALPAFTGITLYFIFHSAFPNKQERFIMPVLPLVMTFGLTGLYSIVRNSTFWLNHKKLLKGFWISFWIINSILLVMFTFTYSKKTRVESLYYLSKAKDVNGIYIDGGKLGFIFQPTFYLNKYGTPIYSLTDTLTLQQTKNMIDTIKKPQPNYIIFFGIENLEKRKSDFQIIFGKNLEFRTEIDPSFIDDIFYRLNPEFNKNEAAFIYSVE